MFVVLVKNQCSGSYILIKGTNKIIHTYPVISIRYGKKSHMKCSETCIDYLQVN